MKTTLLLIIALSVGFLTGFACGEHIGYKRGFDELPEVYVIPVPPSLKSAPNPPLEPATEASYELRSNRQPRVVYTLKQVLCVKG